jgi:hypothetical protein
MYVNKEWKLTPCLVGAIGAEVGGVSCLKVRLVVCKTVIKIWIAPFSINVVSMLLLFHVLKKRKLLASAHNQICNPNVRIICLKTVPFVFCVLAWYELTYSTVFTVELIL